MEKFYNLACWVSSLFFLSFLLNPSYLRLHCSVSVVESYKRNMMPDRKLKHNFNTLQMLLMPLIFLFQSLTTIFKVLWKVFNMLLVFLSLFIYILFRICKFFISLLLNFNKFKFTILSHAYQCFNEIFIFKLIEGQFQNTSQHFCPFPTMC